MSGSWSQRRIAWRIKDDAARQAQARADRLTCAAWNERMRLLGGPAMALVLELTVTYMLPLSDG
jgi:hypothetical protein